MDLQIKLVNQYHREKNIIINDESNIDYIFEINEFDSLNICCSSSKEIEHFEIESPTVPLKFYRDERICIASFENNLLFVPGIYQMRAVTEIKCYTYYFKVIPNNISEFCLNDMVDILEAFKSGLTSDIFLRREMSKIGMGGTGSIFEVSDFVYENHEFLVNNLEGISNSPHTRLEKEYKYYKFPKKIDSKTTKKLIQNSSDLTLDKPYFQSYMKDTYDTNVNRWLKNRLIEILDFLAEHVKMVEFYLHELEKDVEQLSTKLLNKEAKYNQLRLKREISDTYKTNYLKTLKYIRLQVQEAIENKILVLKIKDKINPTIGYINYFMQQSFMKEINCSTYKGSYDQYVFKEYRYTLINSYYERLILNRAVELNVTKGYSVKQTYLLFEYYCVIYLIRLIQNEGYIWTNGWLMNDTHHLHDLVSGTELVFIKNEHKLLLQYDREIFYQVESGLSDFVAINSPNRKPDILLSHYVDNKLKAAIIFEVKYRNSKYIYSEHGDTSVIEQLKNYLQLAYFDSESENTMLNVIKKVVVLYPTQKNKIHYNDRLFAKKFCFINIEPRIDFENDESFEKICILLDNLISDNF